MESLCSRIREEKKKKTLPLGFSEMSHCIMKLCHRSSFQISVEGAASVEACFLYHEFVLLNYFLDLSQQSACFGAFFLF